MLFVKEKEVKEVNGPHIISFDMQGITPHGQSQCPLTTLTSSSFLASKSSYFFFALAAFFLAAASAFSAAFSPFFSSVS